MLMNFFSPMDPSSAIFSSNWLSIMLPMMFIPPLLYFFPSRSLTFSLLILDALKKEIYPLIKKINSQSFILPFLTIFITIILANLSSLYPYIFTHTSHMSYNLTIAFPFWLTLIMFAWMYNMNSMMIHFIPPNTPMPLIPFMVMIEATSQLIRPLTLSVRLMTNSMAGHLLLTLLSASSLSMNTFSIMFLYIPLMAMILLETAVSCIQAYVFMILLTLYAKEIS